MTVILALGKTGGKGFPGPGKPAVYLAREERQRIWMRMDMADAFVCKLPGKLEKLSEALSQVSAAYHSIWIHLEPYKSFRTLNSFLLLRFGRHSILDCTAPLWCSSRRAQLKYLLFCNFVNNLPPPHSLCSNEAWTLGLEHARQVFYHRATSPAFKMFVWDKSFINFLRLTTNWLYSLNLPYSWITRLTIPVPDRSLAFLLHPHLYFLRSTGCTL